MKPFLKSLPFVAVPISRPYFHKKTHGSRIIWVGDCIRDIASKHGIPFVSGCPPKAVDVLRKI